MAGSIYQISKPMSVKEISSKAQDFRFDTAIALKYWLRTAETLLREVRLLLQCLVEAGLTWAGSYL
jgi:STAM-binding protein